MGEKPLRIRFDQIDGFIKVYDGIRYLVIFDYWSYDENYNRIRCFISEERGIIDSINHNFGRIRIFSYDSLTIAKIFAFYNVIILI